MAASGTQLYIPAVDELDNFSVNKRQTLSTVVVAMLCVGILVLFTDLEVQLVRWVNCGTIATEAERESEVCR